MKNRFWRIVLIVFLALFLKSTWVSGNKMIAVDTKIQDQINHVVAVEHIASRKEEILLEIKKLKEKISKLSNIESFQLFTPTPMTNSTCMYWTEMDPKNMKKIKVIHDYKTKKRMKRIILEALSKNN